MKEDPERGSEDQDNADFLRSGCSLGDTGLSEMGGCSGDLNDETTGLFGQTAPRSRGFLGDARAVSSGSTGFRKAPAVTAAHTQADLEYALDVFEKTARN